MPYIGNITSDFSIDTGNITNRAVTATKLSPSSVGSNGQVLSVDGSGNLQWGNDANAPEGTAVLSTGESGTTKYLRVDGDGTCSWQLAVDATKMPLAGGTFSGDVSFYGGTTNVIIRYDASDNALEFWDTTKAVFGSGNELEIKSDGTNGVINQVTDDLLIQTAGSSKFVLKADGKVGIGTTSPNSILDVRENKDGAETQIRLFNTDNGDTTTQTTAFYMSPDSRGTALTGLRSIKENADFSTNAGRDVSLTLNTLKNNSQTEGIRITSDGNVGIGTTSPEDLLHIKTGKIRIENAIVSNNDSTISYDDSDFLIDVDPNNVRGSSQFQIKIDTVAGLTIDDNRKVGIGTTSPSQLLDIASTAPNLRFTDTVDGHSEIDGNAASLKFNADKGDAKADTTITFAVDNSEKMRIDSSGRLLIGTTTEGDDNADDLTIATTGNTGITIRSGANYKGAIYFSDATTGTDEYKGYIQYDQQSDNLKLGCASQTVVWLHDDKKLSVGYDSTGYGQWSFLNIGSSGADATGGDTGLTIRSDTGPTNNSVVSNGDWTLKLNNNAYAGTGVSGNTGTVVKLLFNGATSNGWNAYGAMGLDVQGQSGGKGDLFFNTGGTTDGHTRLRISYQGKVIMGTATDTTDTSERFFVDGSGANDHCGLGIKTNNATYDGFVAFHDTDSNHQGAIRYTHSQDRMKFRTGGNNERICLDGDGLKFHGDTAAANALNDYEEGTWNPQLVGYWSSAWRDMTNDGTVYGRYVKVGNLCYIYGYLDNVQFTGNGVDTYAAIWSLPFTHANTTYGSTISVTHSNIFSNCNAGNFYVGHNTNRMYSSQYGDNDYNYCTWSGTDTRYMMFSGCYHTT
jgi:hypothetical protein